MKTGHFEVKYQGETKWMTAGDLLVVLKVSPTLISEMKERPMHEFAISSYATFRWVEDK